MQINHVDYRDVPQLSFKDKAYIHSEDFLTDYYNYPPTLEGFDKAIEERQKHPVDRVTLIENLKNDYETRTAHPSQLKNIDALSSDRTFTVITAHQPSLLTGPLYYIYKICSIIHLSKTLNKTYPKYRIVPVFVNGAEDHDFDEIDHLNVYGKSIQWQRDAEGAVGRLDTTGLDAAIAHIKEVLGSKATTDALFAKIDIALKHAHTYNDFVFQLVNDLFESYGLLVMNMDKPLLKRNFIPILERELVDRPSEQLVKATQEALSKHGFKAQAYPRDINLFYLGDGKRQRITHADGVYTIVDTEHSFSKEEILDLLHKHPQHFSPNVVLRPVYQEYTLPNLAYIGGGGEISYWLERKRQFEHFNVFFPMLMRRNSVLLLDKGSQKQLRQLDLSIDKLFQNKDAVIDAFLQNNILEDISVEEELHNLRNLYQSMADKAAVYDPTLKKSILADMTKHAKHVEQLGGRIKRAVKSREEVNVNKIKKLKQKLFPNDGLQERHDNILQYYATHGDMLINFLVNNLDPLDRRFSIISL